MGYSRFTVLWRYRWTAKELSHTYGASLVAQRVKRLPALQETWVWSLGQEDPLTRKWQPTPVFLPGEFHGQRSLAGYSPLGRTKSDMTEQLTHTHTHTHLYAHLPHSVTITLESHHCLITHKPPGWDLGLLFQSPTLETPEGCINVPPVGNYTIIKYQFIPRNFFKAPWKSPPPMF